MKVYVGSSMHNIPEIRRRSADLRAVGVDVLSTWPFEPPDRPAGQAAAQDYVEIMAVDALVLDLTKPSSSGGLHTELGIALGRRIPIYTIGALSNVFETLASRRFETWPEFLLFMQCQVHVN